ncbi:MAG: alkaline phosphatase family protein [bacterium]|nr:alkaline phosphatase family protein [bacterium]
MIRRIGDKSGRRLFIIGLDGASFNYLDPILDSCDLPNFRKFFEGGARSDCFSTIPPLTPPAWSTMLTGVNPGKHGVFDFLQPDSSGLFHISDASTRVRNSFLDHAIENNIRTINLLVPYTFPVSEKNNGLSISGLGTPSAESDFIRPHSYRDRLLHDFEFLRNIDPTRNESIETLHKKLLKLTEGAVDLGKFALNEFPDVGIFFVVFQATDLVPHFYSKYFDPSHPDFSDVSDIPNDFRDSLAGIYRAIDPFLGECMDHVEQDGGWVILVSDHGSGPLVGAIAKDAFIARWLEENGYLITSGDSGRTRQTAKAEMGSFANRLLYLAKKYTPHGIRNLFNRLMGESKEKIVGKITAIPFMEDIDWEKTRAFCAPGGYGVGLYINRDGDFPHGTVSTGAEYHKIRDEIRAGFESMQIVDGVPLFRKVIPREEALWGPEIRFAPDLFLLWREDPLLRINNYTLTNGMRLDPPEKKHGSGLTWCGTHKIEGLFGIFGENVMHGISLEKTPSLNDLLPTIHLLSDLAVPSDIDGSVISEAFDPEFIGRHKLKIRQEQHRHDTANFIKGMVIGFGLAAVASSFFNLFTEQRSRRKEAMATETRFRRHDESGNVLGELSNIIDESSQAFRDAVRTLDKTFESGQAAIESVQSVIDKIREP